FRYFQNSSLAASIQLAFLAPFSVRLPGSTLVVVEASSPQLGGRHQHADTAFLVTCTSHVLKSLRFDQDPPGILKISEPQSILSAKDQHRFLVALRRDVTAQRRQNLAPEFRVTLTVKDERTSQIETIFVDVRLETGCMAAGTTLNNSEFAY